MQELRSLTQKVDSWPTILSAKQELELITGLRKIENNVLLDQFSQLCHILERLGESHAGGAIFEVSDLNRDEFDAGANWIESLAKQPLPKEHQAFLHSIADTLRTRFTC